MTGPPRPPSSSGGSGGSDRNRDQSRFKKGKRDDGGLRVNEDIYAPQVRLIDESGAMLGVMTSREALAIAQGRALDLIEIAPTATPPTCKIMDYGKWKYESKKKEKVAKKKQTVISVKEIQVRPRTDSHDLDVKIRHARRFLLDGDKVKVNLRFLGRELAHQDQGYKILKRLQAALLDICIVETPPKMEGKQMFLLLAPDPVKVKDFLKSQPKPELPTNEELEKDKKLEAEEA